MKIFFDTSAFAKRYIAEAGSNQVLALSGQAGSLLVSVICLPELILSLSRLVREKKLSKRDYAALKQTAADDLADADIVQLAPEVLSGAIHLLESSLLRTMEALHVACALASKAELFVSADIRQLAAARKAGLRVADVS